jgi:hypothetical protein
MDAFMADAPATAAACAGCAGHRIYSIGQLLMAAGAGVGVLALLFLVWWRPQLKLAGGMLHALVP